MDWNTSVATSDMRLHGLTPARIGAPRKVQQRIPALHKWMSGAQSDCQIGSVHGRHWIRAHQMMMDGSERTHHNVCHAAAWCGALVHLRIPTSQECSASMAEVPSDGSQEQPE